MLRLRLALLPILLAALLAPASMSFGQEAPDYIGSEACADCHVEAADAWRKSHHALAWTRPSPDTVAADFDGTEFANDAMSVRFDEEPDGSRRVTVVEGGETVTYPLHSVVGTEPLQQYLLETERGRLQSFDVVWDTERGGWFHLYPNQDLPPSDGMHWSGPYKNWNARCAVCHATGYEKNFDPATDSYASTEAEIGVGCEACHGPGEAHLAWARGEAIATSGAELDAYGLTMSFETAEATIQQCAGCHSRREEFLAGSPLPGTPFHDAYNLATLRPGLYHADGQILDEVYVYGSFLQSRMYAQGVGCVDCHDPHTARTVAEGNAVCTQCHSPEGREDFPQAAGAYDTPAHHFHDPAGEGAQCKSCHMIERVYMGVDGRRDHSFRIPRPDLAAATGGPDACTDCHAEQDAEWAASVIREWYPSDANRGPHYGETLARGRQDPVSAALDLADLAADPDEPGIVRATALWLLEQASSPSTAERLAPLLDDPDPLVRAAAVGLQRSAEPQDRVLRLLDSLDDTSRNVRLAAAKELLDAPIARLPDATDADLRAAIGEWQKAMSNRLDFPETHLQIGGSALMLRNLPAASAAFREAVRMDPQQVEAWVMLVRIAAALGDGDAARAALDEALEANPGDTRLLGLTGRSAP